MPKPIVPVSSTVADLRRRVRAWRKEGRTIGLIPTMGALHEGHLALVALARERCERVVTSIFVNPTQFAPNEDFDKYPRTFEADLAMLKQARCNLVWAPARSEMYRDGFATRIVPSGPAEGLESDFRPHFFAGVATVCCKLFTQVQPDIAVFGEKDFQQLAVVRQMVRDLDLPLTIVGAPTVREADGLAMSSRNRYLTTAERRVAPLMNEVIVEVARTVSAGADPAGEEARARERLTGGGFRQVDYVAVRDAATLGPYRHGLAPGRVLAAAWLGQTRLIDNVAL